MAIAPVRRRVGDGATVVPDDAVHELLQSHHCGRSTSGGRGGGAGPTWPSTVSTTSAARTGLSFDQVSLHTYE